MTAAPADEPEGRLTRDKLNDVLAAIQAQLGIDVSDPHLIKFTNNAVFRLTRAPIVVRVAGSGTASARIHKVVKVARWLEEHDVPAVRLLPGVPQPVTAAGHLLTLWRAVPHTGPPPTGGDLAGVLRHIHRLPPPTFELPPWRPLDEIRQRLAEPEGIEAADLAFLRDCTDALEDDLRQLAYQLPPGPIHGDAFLGNLISGPQGTVICDFDSTSTGPREWDLTPVAVGRLRFDYPGDAHRELADRYGFDVTRWEGFAVLRRLRELKLVTSVIPVLRSNPDIRQQWQHRFNSFKRGDTTARWTPYS